MNERYPNYSTPACDFEIEKAQYVEPEALHPDNVVDGIWYDATEHIPPMHRYVLVGLRELPIFDDGDNEGAYYKVMCRDVMENEFKRLKGNFGTYEWVEFGPGENWRAQFVTVWMSFSRSEGHRRLGQDSG